MASASGQPYGFTGASVGRIRAAVKRIEALPTEGDGPAPNGRTRASPIVHPIEITSTTPDADGYMPGTCLPFFDPETGDVSGDEEILILDLNA